MGWLGNAILLLVSGVLVDIVWARYIIYVGERARKKAATYSALTGIPMIILIESVKDDWTLAPFWIAGLWFGTYWATGMK